MQKYENNRNKQKIFSNFKGNMPKNIYYGRADRFKSTRFSAFRILITCISDVYCKRTETRDFWCLIQFFIIFAENFKIKKYD